MQFIVTGYDGTDAEALQRRLDARDAHLRMVEKMAGVGKHLYGAALLDDNDKMIGSMLVVDFPTREELDSWLKIEPYVTGGVWQKIEVNHCRVAPIFMKR